MKFNLNLHPAKISPEEANNFLENSDRLFVKNIDKPKAEVDSVNKNLSTVQKNRSMALNITSPILAIIITLFFGRYMFPSDYSPIGYSYLEDGIVQTLSTWIIFWGIIRWFLGSLFKE